MKNKKIAILASATIIATSVITLTTLIASSTQNILFSKASDQTYNISFNSGKNKFHDYTNRNAYSGDATIQTDLGNDIDFTYNNLLGGSSTWHILEKDTGDFYNTDPIHGMETLTLSFLTETDFTITWANNSAFENSDSEVFTSSTSSPTVCNFDGDYPAYFKVSGASARLNISSMSISLTCKNYYPTLSISSNDTTMGTVSGDSGVIFSGTNVNIVATPNAGYRFVGWYKGDTLISPNASYSFTMGNVDLSYVARFTYESYNLVVESESDVKGTVSESSGSYDYLTPISLEATANPGYTFNGWYDGANLVSTNNPYNFNMPHENITYTAKFTTNSYELTLVNANQDKGSISGAGNYLFGTNVTITATPNIGASFLGWYDDSDALVSTLASYSFTMPHEDVEYTAKFAWTPYTVTLDVNDNTMGSVTGGGSYIYDQEVTLTATPNTHYSFFGWYDGDSLVSQEATYTFNMPLQSLEYSARFVRNYALSINSDDESMGTVSGPTEWGAGLEVTVTANPLSGYALDRWEDENYNDLSHDSSYTFIMPEHDIELWAVFGVGYALTVSSSDTSKGTVDGSGYYISGRNVTVTMTYQSGTFKGWYDSNGVFVSSSNPFTFVMPSSDYSLTAVFMTEEEKETWNSSHGVTPVVNNENNTITYGLYPQTRVSDTSLLSILNSLQSTDSNGWYFCDGDYYVKLIAEPNSSNYSFDDGSSIVSGETYWFECEPIVWRILSNTNGTYYLLSSVLLDKHCYYSATTNRQIDGKTIYPNNYEYSDIRSWLNDDFYNMAFSYGDSYIQISEVDNSSSTLDKTVDDYACNNTADKVFLPSYKDYLKTSYGFTNSESATETRTCRTTDWARARGAYQVLTEGYVNNGWYWSRSPKATASSNAWYGSSDGRMRMYSVNTMNLSVRPAINLLIV